MAKRRACLTIEAIAAKARCSRSTVHDVLNGRRCNSTGIKAIADALGVPMEFVMLAPGQPKRQTD